MPAQDALELEVADFGPIVEAKVDLRPLTVFVGPSNTGKSWLAILIYALHRCFSGGAEGGVNPFAHAYYMARQGSRGLDEGTIKELVKLAEQLSQTSGSSVEQAVALSGPVAGIVRGVLNSQGDRLGKEIRRAYGIEDAGALIRKERRTRAKVVLRRRSSSIAEPLEHYLSIERRGTSFVAALPEGLRLKIQKDAGLRRFLREYPLALSSDSSRRRWIWRRFLGRLTELALPQVLGPLHQPAFYLPADRTGVMHAHRAVVSSLIESAPTASLRPTTQTSRLSGVVADFLQQLIELDAPPQWSNRRKRRKGLGGLIEREVLEGVVGVERSSVVGYPYFTYLPDGWKEEEALPLTNASSMVSELAPVVLYLRHIVGSESLLIVEEPESHLHPAKQVEFTRQLVAVVRAGVRVIVTTHSEWVLEELGNTVRRSGLPGSRAKSPARGGLALRPEEVGAWLFSPKQRPKGSVVEEIEMDDETGLFPAGYDRVSEALYNEGARIFNQIQRSRGA